MHCRSALGWLTGLTVALAIISLGCDGGDGGGDGGPAPQTGTATLTGTVVSAADTGITVPNAVVTVQGTGGSAVSGADGRFTINNLPAGEWPVEVQTPQSEDYGTADARVPLTVGQTTTVNLAVLPLGTPRPQQILLDPVDATIDVNGRIAYRTQLVGPNNEALEDLQPTWVARGGVGTVDADGVFTAEAVGFGQVSAYAGDAERTGSVVVVAPRPPQIASFRVNPLKLPATGGQVYISAAVTDGDGVNVREVTVQIFAPGDQIIELDMDVTNPDTAISCGGLANCYVDASFGVTYQIPANDNQPTPGGVQAAEQYSARLLVRDRTGMRTQSEFVDFTVEGIDAPPPQPGL